MGQLLFKTLVGALAGFLVWLVMEPFAPRAISDPAWPIWERNFVLALGAALGAAIGGLNGFLIGGKQHTLRGVAFGLVFGAIGAMLGYSIGAGTLSLFGGLMLGSGILPLQMVARTVAFIPMGLFLGAAIGGSSLTAARTKQGAVGGAIGAAIGGLLFDPIGSVLGPAQLQVQGLSQGEVGGPSRAAATIVLGGAIALFIGLVERFGRSAWLRLNLGRNEGKEWSLDAGHNTIGRSEGCAVPLFGDPQVAPVHAIISKQGREWIIQDGGSAAGTLVNGQRVQSALLQPGSMIQVGGFLLHFLTKNAPAPARAHDGRAVVPVPPTQPPSYPTPAAAPTALLPAQMGPPAPLAPTQMAMPAARFVLVAIDGPIAGQRFPVSGPLDLGRESAAVPLGFDSQASRRHAQIAPGPTGLQVTDLGSTNGTFLNGQRVSTGTAGPGDLIRIGSTTFRVDRG